MTSMFLHQNFASDNRLEVLFGDGSCPLYTVLEDDIHWLDTNLVPDDSFLLKTIYKWHTLLSVNELRASSQSLAMICEDPEKRALYCTLRVAISYTEHCKGFLSVSLNRKSIALPLPPINTIQMSTVQMARDVLLLWHYDNDLRKEGPLLWLRSN